MKQNTPEELKKLNEQDQVLLHFINDILLKLHKEFFPVATAAYLQKITKENAPVWQELILHLESFDNLEKAHKNVNNMWILIIKALLSTNSFYDWAKAFNKQLKTTNTNIN